MHRDNTPPLPLAVASLPLLATATFAAEFTKRTDSGITGQQYWQHDVAHGRQRRRHRGGAAELPCAGNTLSG